MTLKFWGGEVSIAIPLRMDDAALRPSRKLRRSVIETPACGGDNEGTVTQEEDPE
jgi:hypothetical protein